MSYMDPVAFNNDLGHPICDNIRQGDWLIDYTVGRLKATPKTKPLSDKLQEAFQPIKEIPRYLTPCYFHLFASHVYKQMVEAAWSLMSALVNIQFKRVRAQHR